MPTMSKKADSKIIMNYRDVFFIGNLLIDDEEFLKIMENWKNPSSSKGPKIVRFCSKSPQLPLPFRIEAAAYYSVEGGHKTVRQSLSNYQVILTRGGRATITYKERQYLLTAGTGMVIDCRQPHIYEVAENDFWEYKHIHFLVNGAQLLVDEADGFTSNYGVAESYFDELIAYSCNEDSAAPFVYSNIINNILTALILSRKRGVTIRDNNTLIEEISQYLHAHYAENLSMNDVAEHFYLSVYHFIKLFKQYCGVTPHRYLMEYRLNRAKEFLVMGRTVEETASLCGFGSLNNFYKVFKNALNTTPKSYAQQHGGSDTV